MFERRRRVVASDHVVEPACEAARSALVKVARVMFGSGVERIGFGVAVVWVGGGDGSGA